MKAHRYAFVGEATESRHASKARAKARRHQHKRSRQSAQREIREELAA